MTKLNRNEVPNTKTAFLEKWRTDRVFKARAEYTGFEVIFDCVKLPNGKIAGVDVK